MDLGSPCLRKFIKYLIRESGGAVLDGAGKPILGPGGVREFF